MTETIIQLIIYKNLISTYYSEEMAAILFFFGAELQ